MQVTGADFHRVEPVENVELGERQFRERVESHRMAQHHAVQPSATTSAAGDGAELTADLGEPLAVVVEQLGYKGAGTDTRGVRLGDTDDATEVAGSKTRPDAGASSSGIR